MTQAHWLKHVYPKLKPNEKPLECVVHAGQAIYFPTGWHHGVLNLDETVFVSAFHRTSNVFPDKHTLMNRMNLPKQPDLLKQTLIDLGIKQVG